MDFWGWRVMGSIMAAIVRAIETAAAPLSRRKNPLRESGGREEADIPSLLLRYRIPFPYFYPAVAVSPAAT